MNKNLEIMTEKQIKQLTDLQTKIENIESHLKKMTSWKRAITVNYPPSINGYVEKIPLELVDNLHTEIVEIVIDRFQKTFIDLIEKREALHICTAEKNETTYKPIEDIDQK